jgi:hypothetical protein
MSLIGKVQTIHTTRIAGNLLSLDSYHADDFTHEAGFTTTTTVVKGDVTSAKIGDTYTVKVAYPNGSVPAGTTKLDDLVTTATAAVTAAFGASELT